MPSWYVHIQAAAETMELLKAGVPAGSPLTQAQADDLFMAAHDHRNYLAVGALGPDLFFLLPDFKGEAGKGLLALLDIGLPDISGYEVARRIRQLPASRGARIIATTGYGLKSDREASVEASEKTTPPTASGKRM